MLEYVKPKWQQTTRNNFSEDEKKAPFGEDDLSGPPMPGKATAKVIELIHLFAKNTDFVIPRIPFVRLLTEPLRCSSTVNKRAQTETIAVLSIVPRR